MSQKGEGDKSGGREDATSASTTTSLMDGSKDAIENNYIKDTKTDANKLKEEPNHAGELELKKDVVNETPTGGVEEQVEGAEAVNTVNGEVTSQVTDVTEEGVLLIDPTLPVTCQPGFQPYCPPSLTHLLESSQVVVHKANFRHNKKINDCAVCRFEVVDETRRVLFYVEQDPAPLSQHSFMFKFYNRESQEVMGVYNPESKTCLACGISWHCFSCFKFQAVVFAPAGVVAGFVRRARTYIVQEYEILDATENVIFLLRGGPEDLEIYSPDLEHELGRLSVHGWHGIMHEVRRSGQDIGLTFPMDLDVRFKAVLIGAIFAIDWIYTTRGGNRQ